MARWEKIFCVQILLFYFVISNVSVTYELWVDKWTFREIISPFQVQGFGKNRLNHGLIYGLYRTVQNPSVQNCRKLSKTIFSSKIVFYQNNAKSLKISKKITIICLV